MVQYNSQDEGVRVVTPWLHIIFITLCVAYILVRSMLAHTLLCSEVNLFHCMLRKGHMYHLVKQL